MLIRVCGLCLILTLFAQLCGAAQDRPGFQSGQETVLQGIRAGLEVVPLKQEGAVTGRTVLQEGDLATVRLKLSDALTGAAVTALMPKLWIDLQKDAPPIGRGVRNPGCSDKVRGYLQGTLSFRPDVDLNSYFILTLNNDATIGVIDPIRGVTGYSQLLTMIPLARPGEDWVYSQDGASLFVTMPKAGQVAVIDTETFTVRKNLEAGSNPHRIALQPDGKYLWVGNNGEDVASGVTVLDARSGMVVARLATGAGRHELAFSDDSSHVFVSNRTAGTVSVIDVQRLQKVAEIATGLGPVGMAYSRLSQALYVAHEGDGSVAVLDGNSFTVMKRIQLSSGLSAIRFAPGDRWGFVVNSRNRQLSVFDASSNAVTHGGEVGNEPEQVAFSREFAYIRSRKTADVTLIALAALGKGGAMAPLRISGGGIAPGESTIQSSPADSIVTAPEGNAVLIASPADGTVVYYMEGMGVPSGNFRTYGRVPRAVSVVNRQVRESSPGNYSATFRVPSAGRYDVAMLLDSPRLVHCFQFEASANPVTPSLKSSRPVLIEILDRSTVLLAGRSNTLRFRVNDSASGRPLPDIRDITVLASLAPTGAWRQPFNARIATDQVYEIDFKPPQPGRYTLYFSIPSLQVKISQVLPLDLLVQ